ncbi:MAG: molybdate ABC transporter substrate-binding protein [Geminicoccaceae bacterium]
MRMSWKLARRSLLAAVVVATATMAGGPVRADDKPVLVFAAASLKNALDQVIEAYAKQGGLKVTASYAASSALAKQVEQGAEADLFFSADLDWMAYLDQRKLIAADSQVNLLGNDLVLVAPADAQVPAVELAKGADLAGLLGADGRLAMGEVKSVPAGKYGKASLESLGLWASVEKHIAQADNVRAALALVARGEAPLGIVYKTDAAAEPKVKIVGTFPADSHPPIIYPVALTSTAAPGGADFLKFLRSAAALDLFKAQGFTVVDKPAS